MHLSLWTSSNYEKPLQLTICNLDILTKITDLRRWGCVNILTSGNLLSFAKLQVWIRSLVYKISHFDYLTQKDTEENKLKNLPVSYIIPSQNLISWCFLNKFSKAWLDNRSDAFMILWIMAFIKLKQTARIIHMQLLLHTI